MREASLSVVRSQVLGSESLMRLEYLGPNLNSKMTDFSKACLLSAATFWALGLVLG